MKVAHIISGLIKGGAERVVVTLANEAAAAGHDVTVVSAYPVDAALNRAALRREVKVKFVCGSARPRLRRYLALLPWLWRHRAWIRDQDVVHCHLTFGTVAGTVIRWMRGLAGSRTPLILETYHAVGMPISARARFVSRALAVGRDGCVLMAKDDDWAAFSASHPDLPIAFIPNGIDTSIERPADEERRAYLRATGIPEGILVVGTIGRLLAERKPLDIVRTFAEIAARPGPEVHFLIGGEGPMAKDIQAEAERLGLAPRLHLPGLIKRAPLTLSAIDLYVSINVRSVTGVAGLEAAALGVPVVALQALASYDAGEGDWIWSNSDPAAVAGEAARLLRDPAARRFLAQVQQAHVRQRHSATAMWEAYETFYRCVGCASS